MSEDPKLRREDVEDAAEAFLGVNVAQNTVRTVVDTLLWPNRVVAAAFANDQSNYIRPFRLFVMLFGLQLLLTALIGTPFLGDFEVLAPWATPELINTYFAEAGVDSGALQSSLNMWVDLSLWPLTIFGLVPYLLLLKAYKPSRSLYGSFLALIIAFNASYLVLLPALPTAPLNQMIFMTIMMSSFLWFFVNTARIIARYYAEGFAGTAFKTIGVVVVTPISLAAVFALQLLLIEAVLQAHGVSLAEMFTLGMETSETPPS